MLAPDVAAVAGRCAVFAATLVLWGAALFRHRLSPRAPRLRHEGWLVGLLLLGLLLSWPAAIARIAGGWASALDPGVVATVVEATTPGRALAVQSVCALLVALAFALRSDRGLLLSGLGIMIGSSLTGHAAASEGALGYLRQGNNVLHWVAAGAWLGALPYVLPLMARLAEAEARTTLIRYSGEGHAFVALVLVTGTVATLFVFGGIPTDWSVPYRMLWAGKVAAVLAMVALAVRNRYWLVPRLADDPGSLAALRRATLAEIALGLLAVALVACFGTLDPR